MLTFVLTTILVLTAFCAGVFVVVTILIVMNTVGVARDRWFLPPPERQTERVYGQQYFDRAVSNQKK